MSLEKFSWSGEAGHVDTPAEEPPKHWRPRTRKDCDRVSRPCPYVGCRHNLAMDVRGASLMHAGGKEYGSKTLKLAADEQRIEQWSDDLVTVLSTMGESCALDVAEGNGSTQEEIGDLIGIVYEGVALIERRALNKLRDPETATSLLELLDAMDDTDRPSPLAEAQEYASLAPGDVAALRDAKG